MEHTYLTKVGAYSWYIYGTAAKAATVGVCTHMVLEIYIDWIIGVTQGSGLISSSAYPAPPQSNAFPTVGLVYTYLCYDRSCTCCRLFDLVGFRYTLNMYGVQSVR